MKAVVAAAIMIAAGACGGDGIISSDGGGIPSGPTLSSLQTSIFTPRCAIDGCHAGTGPQQGLDLSSGMTYAHVVKIASAELAQFERVAPGNSADSYLVMKLEGDPRIAGSPMPLVGGALTPAEIDAIRQWIDAGAKND